VPGLSTSSPWGVELEEALGVKVDVGTPASLRQHLRDGVLAQAVVL